MTVGTPSSTIATHEFVVPRSIPITRSIAAFAPRCGPTVPTPRPAFRVPRPRARGGAWMLAQFAVSLRTVAHLGCQILDSGIVRSQFQRSINLGQSALFEPGGGVGTGQCEP